MVSLALESQEKKQYFDKIHVFSDGNITLIETY
jgi:hypothetical protein